uniref:Uncharacterized protein n=1 Tax=Tanacetum cinerariifolium TaxID=118510 RepID=A0A699RLX7_TANCI|nr:hypothetical protein [Tanacetum cinerariifolium]
MIPASTSFSTSACIDLVRSGACPLFFCRTGGHPSRTLSLCSAMERGTPVMSEGCHAKMSKFLFNREHNLVRHASDNDPPTTTS